MRRECMIGWMGLLGGAVTILLAGCATQTHAQAKEAAYHRWTAARAGILYSLALDQFRSGDLDTAYQSCKQGMGMAPKNPEFFELGGRVMLEQSRLELAHKFLTRALELDPKRGAAHYLLGVIYQRWQQYDKALVCYDRAFELQGDDVSGLLASAEMLVKLNRADEALKRLNEKLAYFEHNAALRSSIARIYMMQHKYDQAVDLYRQAQLLSSDDPQIAEQLAMAEMAAGQPLEAIYQLTSLLGKPDYQNRTDLKLALVDCYLATNEPESAGRLCLKLTRADPNNVDAWMRLGQSAFLVNEGHMLQQAADRLNELAPDRCESHLLAGMAAEQRGDDRQAVLDYTRATQCAADQPAAWLMQGMALERLGRITQAEKAYRKAATLAPKDPRVRTLLAGLTKNDNH